MISDVRSMLFLKTCTLFNKHISSYRFFFFLFFFLFFFFFVYFYYYFFLFIYLFIYFQSSGIFKFLFISYFYSVLAMIFRDTDVNYGTKLSKASQIRRKRKVLDIQRQYRLLSEDTQEMSLSRSRAYPGERRNLKWQNNSHIWKRKVREKVQGVPQSQTAAFPDTKRKRKQTKPNKRKSNKRTKNTNTGSLFPKRGNCNAKRTEKNTRTK